MKVIFDYNLSKHAMASFFSAVNRFSDPQRERFRPLAEKDHKGRMKTRLYDIIHRNRDGQMTADELQAALRLPAKAQAISQLVLRKESEWFYQAQKWDALDELLGHSGSTPHLNWVAEKQRIEQMGWWSEVAEKVGLPPWGRPYHLHPLGLVGLFTQLSCACERDITLAELQAVISEEQAAGGLFQKNSHSEIHNIEAGDFLVVLNEAMDRYGIRECLDKAFFLANIAIECDRFKATEEYKNKNGSIPDHWHNYRGGSSYHGS